MYPLTNSSTKVQCSSFVFDGLFDGDLTDGTLTFTTTVDDYKDDVYEPGTYLVSIKGTVLESLPDSPVSKSATFFLRIQDPCDPPVSIGTLDLSDESYTITDVAKIKVHEAVPIEPDYCPVIYTIREEPTLIDASAQTTSAISYTDFEIRIHYEQDLAPLTQVQTVTVVATSSSKYPLSSQPLSSSSHFNLRYLNPCID